MYLFRNSRFALFWTLATIALGVLLIHNTTIYFQPNVRAGFLVEKGDIVDSTIWRGAFYFHIVTSCLVLATGFPLFFTRLLKYRRLHVFLGYVYINGVLWFAAPTGLILAPFAKGGWPAATGFLLTGIAWWYCTWQGYLAIRKKRINEHIGWMVRSWCLSLSAITFRLIHVGLFAAGLDPLTNYVVSIWLSLLANVFFAEYFVWRNLSRSDSETAVPDQVLATSF